LSGTLYLVATPIGHLGDVTERAIETLRAAHRVVAEDTRRTRTLLTHLAIERKPLSSLEAHAAAREIERVLHWLGEGEDVAFVTDAGVPAVSDPGAALVKAAVDAGVRVVPIPGASAVTAAVAASGVVTGGFRFFGFLPRGGTARADALGSILSTPESVVFFESPQRIAETLRELAELCPDRALVVAREMTKVHEEFVRGTVAEVAAAARDWMGEITLVLGPDAEAGAGAKLGDAEVDARIDAEIARGQSVKDIAQRVAAWSGRSRREIYERVVSAKSRTTPGDS
jgi:16S rRNA (cytidine1402-2'-O)-methyltransferase